MSVRIITDSAADLTPDELARFGVDACIPLQVTFGSDEYVIGENLSPDAFWARLIGGETAMTSQPAPETFLRAFEAAAADADGIVYIGLSSALSGTLQSAAIARSMTEHDGVHIVDSLSATVGQKQLVLAACRMRSEGMSAERIAAALCALRARIRIFATVDTLEYLARGGRISRAAASIGSLAQLKPQITLSADGRVEVYAKAIGRHRAIDAMVKKVLACRIDDAYPVIPVYSFDSANMLAFTSRLSAADVSCDSALATGLGAIIGTHVGPNAYGVCFVEAQ